MLAAALTGIALVVANRRWGQGKWAVLLPTGSSLGLAFIIDPAESLTLCFGVLLTVLWERRNKKESDGACGLPKPPCM